MFPTSIREYSSKMTLLALPAICLSYLIFQLIYIPNAALSVDEFWFAHHIFQYTQQLPYRDFLPYKTVVGYYLLSIPLWFSHALLQPLYLIKDEIAWINTFCIAGASIWLMRFFQPRAVIFSVLLILANNLFLIYSVDLRVDMLTSWLGLFSLLLILSNRFLLSGLVLALSFMISQKALWFWLATNTAFGFYWLFLRREWQVVRRALLFNLAVIIPIALYVLFWALKTDWNTVLNSVFYEGYTQAKITWYSQIYYQCWKVILANGPLLVFLWPLTWIVFLFAPMQPRRFFIAVYAAVMMFFIISYQQAFPYNMVFAVPVYFLIYPDFFSWLLTFIQKNSVLAHQRKLFWFVSLYTISMVSITILLGLPLAYFLIVLVPILLGIMGIAPTLKNTLQSVFWMSLIFTGLLYPLLRFSFTAYAIRGDYQRANITMAHALLQEGGGYFAGTPLLYDQNQAIPGLKNLIGPAIEYLTNPSPKILPIMISSLYLEPRSDQQVIHDLGNKAVKFYVNSYRIYALPESIHAYLDREFMHYWGSIYIYATQIQTQQKQFRLKFSGTYQVIGKPGTLFKIDQQKMAAGSQIILTAGTHLSQAKQNYRLKYLPEKNSVLDWRYSADKWYKIVKAIVL